MKYFICFIVLLNFCYCIEYYNVADKDYLREWREDLNPGGYRDERRYGDRDGRDRDDYDHIVRPCSVHDLNCIRRVFADNSRCSPPKGILLDTLELKRLPLNIPHANLTIALKDVKIKGLSDWKIKEFYINKATDRLVLEVVFDKIVVVTPAATFSVNRKGKEPIEATDHTIIEYDDVSLTLTISNIKDKINLSKGNVYTYLPDADPNFSIGPAILHKKDRAFAAAIGELIRNVSISIRELYVTQGPIILAEFLESKICDSKY